MSIASEITRLQGVKTNILQAISDKGVEVPSGSMLADCPDLISSIICSTEVYTERIVGGNGIKVVDESGYIGLVLNDSSSYYSTYAIVVKGADYSSQGLGRVTFVEYGTLEIGGLEYRTLNIGNQTWMAENLQLDVPNSWFYNNDEATYGRNGKNYGRLYFWDAAMGISVEGWHLPTKEEWNELINAVGGSEIAGTKLKATAGWSKGNGTDNYGFSIFPSGGRNDGNYYYLGENTDLWTSSQDSSTGVYSYYFNTGAKPGSYVADRYKFAYSVRLVKDSA